MHDAVTAERLGVVATAIMTEKFVSAAELMGHVLGAPGYAFVTIAHPISSASTADLQAAARLAAVGCVANLVNSWVLPMGGS